MILNWKSHYSFWICLMLACVPVLCATHLTTGDAPCHMYNTRLIYELLINPGSSFTSEFHTLNQEAIPNWLTNLIHLPLLLLLGPVLAEKSFYLIYVATFAFGFRYLVRQIAPSHADVFASIALIFIWAQPIWLGFTNNMLSLALSFWLVGYYLRHRGAFQKKQFAIFFVGTCLLFLAHPMGFIFALLGVFCMTFGLVLERKTYFKNILYEHLILFALCMPTLLLLLRFVSKRTENNRVNPATFLQKLDDFMHLRSLIGLSSRERDIVFACSIGFVVLLILAISNRRKEVNLAHINGGILWLVGALALVFFGPTSFAGGTDVALRLGFLPHFTILLLVAAWINLNPKPLQLFFGFFGVVFSMLLLQVRVPIIREASVLVDEVVQSQAYIKPNATVLTLNFDYGGKRTDGQPISNKTWLFVHVGCYLGQYKPLVIGDNYEAIKDYFPTRAKWNANMWERTEKDGTNFDHFPPRADLFGYYTRTGKHLDYVILINYPDLWAEHAFTKEIEQQLAQGYRQVYRSVNGRAILFERI
jgi:hypothetical protein